MSPLFGMPTFRWLPAKSRIETRFLLFYTSVPEEFTKIEEVKLSEGKLTVVDRSGKELVLAASRGL
jgi:hypothetical protein